ncbi:unnamed protein product, partial [Polarella glacialis]
MDQTYETHELKLGKVLGRGNFAVVFEVEGGFSKDALDINNNKNNSLEGKSAAKILLPVGSKPNDMATAMREARMLALVAGSPYIIALHGLFSAAFSFDKSTGSNLSLSGETGSKMFDMILLERCQGSYMDHLQKTGKQDEASAAVVMLEILKGLSHIHSL